MSEAPHRDRWARDLDAAVGIRSFAGVRKLPRSLEKTSSRRLGVDLDAVSLSVKMLLRPWPLREAPQ